MKQLSFLLILLFSLTTFSQTTGSFDIEGHRGTRGWMPENTVPAFIKAIDLGVNTLELDLAVSRDGKLVVSHEPWFSSAFSIDKDGKPVAADKQMDYNIYKMDYAEIKQFDVGSNGNKDFPQQQKMKVAKPLLTDVFKEVQAYLKKKNLKQVYYNVEIKTVPQGDNVYHPAPDVFAKMVYDQIAASKLQKYVIVQSFDVRPLQELKKYPVKLQISYLTANKDGAEKNIEKLGFKPDIYSPVYQSVDDAMMKYCKTNGIKVIPWTVNEITDLENMKKFGLDGIITDYPDRAVQVFRK